MTPSFRAISFVILASLALVATGCSSSNKGKIEGKWKLTSIPGMDAKTAQLMELRKVYVFVEFKTDGTMVMGAGSSDPATQEELSKSPDAKTLSCKYKLLSGEGVEIYDMPKEMQDGNTGGGLFGKKDRGRMNVKITGDNMTMSDDTNKVMQLTKVK